MPITETERLRVLRTYAVLDTPADPAFDRITALVRLSFDAPIALISLVDEERQWFKSRQGLDVCQTARGQAFCAHALSLERDDILVVEDAALDPRFADNPLVIGDPGIRFYAGAVLVSPEGAALGTLCVIDIRPRPPLTPAQAETLRALAGLVMSELEVQRVRRREAARQRLLSLAEAISGVGHWRLDVATGAVEWSDEVYRIHGVDRASFDPMLDSALDFYDEAGRTAVEHHIGAAIRDGMGFSFQLRLRRRDGQWRTVVSKADCERDANGAVIAIFGVFQDTTEQDALLRRVREDGERYRLLTQNATDVIATYKPDGVFTYLSPSIATLCGRTAEELVGRKTYELIHPDDHAATTRAFLALLDSGQPSTRIEYRVVREDGTMIWVEAHPSPVFDAAGRLSGFQDVVRDISKRRAAQEAALEAARRAEEALASATASEARYRLLAENANDMIATTSLDSTVLFVTPAVRRLLGYEPEEIVGRKTMDLTHPEDRPMVKALFTGLVLAGPSVAVSPYQFRGLHKDGRWVWLEGQPRVQFDDQGAPQLFQDVVRDIGERRRVEIEARDAALAAEAARRVAADSERRYRLLADNATDMISRFSLGGRIKFVSASCERILGYAPEELTGRLTLDFTHAEDVERIRAQYAAYVAAGPGGAPIETQFRAIRKDGQVIWLEGRPKLIFNASGEPREMYDVVRDVTARKQLEAELEAARLAAEAGMQAKADFLANMSHELRTPLTSIIGFTGLVAEQKELSRTTRDYVERVRNASRALLNTVNDILDFSKLEAGEVGITPRPTDVRGVVRSAMDLFSPQAAAKALRLGMTAAPTLPPFVMIDGDRLQQMLLNLIGNAVKFTQSGEVAVRLEYEAGGLRVSVRDTGCGISDAAKAALFKRFSQVDGSSTRTHGGTGLGLAICRGLAERMGGSIAVESTLGAGSRFTLDLPARAVTLSARTASGLAPGAPRPLDALRILVVDDQDADREMARLILAEAGALVTEAADGREALAVCAADPFDAILLDLRMPGLGGPAVLRQLRAAGGFNGVTPVVAYSAEESQARSSALFDGFVGKPVDPGELLETLRRAVDCDGFGEGYALAL